MRTCSIFLSIFSMLKKCPNGSKRNLWAKASAAGLITIISRQKAFFPEKPDAVLVRCEKSYLLRLCECFLGMCEAFYFINTFVLSTTQTQHREADSYFEKCRKTQTDAKKTPGQSKRTGTCWTWRIYRREYLQPLYLLGNLLIIGTEGMLPAVDHHRSSIRRSWGLDPAQESQQARSVVRHAVLRPRGEVELAHFVFGRVTSLKQTMSQV